MSISFQKAPINNDSLKNQPLHDICDFVIQHPYYLGELDQLLSSRSIDSIGRYITRFRGWQSTYIDATYIGLIEELCNLNDSIIPRVQAAILELLLEKLIRRQLEPYKSLIETECFILYNGNKIGIGKNGKGNIDICSYLANRRLGFFYECKIRGHIYIQNLTHNKKAKEWMNSFNRIPSEVGNNKILLRIATIDTRDACKNTGVDTKLKKSWPNVELFYYEEIEFLLSSVKIGDFAPL